MFTSHREYSIVLSNKMRKGYITKSYTTCELVNGGLGHAVSQHTRKLKRRNVQILTYLKPTNGQLVSIHMFDTHWSLPIHTGNIDNGTFGLDQVGYTELSQVVDRSDQGNKADEFPLNKLKNQTKSLSSKSRSEVRVLGSIGIIIAEGKMAHHQCDCIQRCDNSNISPAHKHSHVYIRRLFATVKTWCLCWMNAVWEAVGNGKLFSFEMQFSSSVHNLTHKMNIWSDMFHHRKTESSVIPIERNNKVMDSSNSGPVLEWCPS